MIRNSGFSLQKESDMTYPNIKFKIVEKRLGTPNFGEANVDIIEMHIDNHKSTFSFYYSSLIDLEVFMLLLTILDCQHHIYQ